VFYVVSVQPLTRKSPEEGFFKEGMMMLYVL